MAEITLKIPIWTSEKSVLKGEKRIEIPGQQYLDQMHWLLTQSSRDDAWFEKDGGRDDIAMWCVSDLESIPDRLRAPLLGWVI